MVRPRNTVERAVRRGRPRCDARVLRRIVADTSTAVGMAAGRRVAVPRRRRRVAFGRVADLRRVAFGRVADLRRVAFGRVADLRRIAFGRVADLPRGRDVVAVSVAMGTVSRAGRRMVPVTAMDMVWQVPAITVVDAVASEFMRLIAVPDPASSAVGVPAAVDQVDVVIVVPDARIRVDRSGDRAHAYVGAARVRVQPGAAPSRQDGDREAQAAANGTPSPRNMLRAFHVLSRCNGNAGVVLR